MRYYITYLLLFGWVHDLCGIESEASEYFYLIIECSIVHVVVSIYNIIKWLNYDENFNLNLLWL